MSPSGVGKPTQRRGNKWWNNTFQATSVPVAVVVSSAGCDLTAWWLRWGGCLRLGTRSPHRTHAIDDRRIVRDPRNFPNVRHRAPHNDPPAAASVRV